MELLRDNIPLLTAVGLYATGVTAGLTLSYPLIVSPLFYKSLLPPKENSPDFRLEPKARLAVWHTAYHQGAVNIPYFAAASSVVLTVLGALKSGTQRDLLYTSAALGFFIVPFTFLVIKPVNDKLIASRSSPTIEQNETEQKVMQERFNRWCVLHRVRFTASSVAFVLALLSVTGI